MSQEEYLTIKQVADKAGLTRQAIDKRIKSRKVDIKRFGFLRVIHSKDLEAVLSR